MRSRRGFQRSSIKISRAWAWAQNGVQEQEDAAELESVLDGQGGLVDHEVHGVGGEGALDQRSARTIARW